jgi:hypothetical protein
MLWVILKLHNVIAAIVATHQVSLRTPTHPPDMLDGLNHGDKC